jgi:hypothetical protein
MVMQEIEDIRARLEAAPLAADALAATLAAALDAFGVLLASCRDSEERSVELFAAFAFAAAAAAEGRHILLTTPSLPSAQGLVTSHAACVQADLEVTADALAGLAGTLSRHLSSAARRAQDPGDHAACCDAAREAARVHELLARGD